jgi:crossover junction endodeoxyribonuclease RusA
VCKEQKIPALPQVKLYATVYFPDQRRRDLDNYFPGVFKPALDGLVAAGVIPDDDTRYVPELPGLRFDFDHDNPRTEITITALD